ncbi:hypothetical protein O7599_19045 [Streptomyces sp. WMMC500]|nr:hypothetical protein [Streptomyces sp. WMMC500]WBB57783.1 hypothetical protein O7599_19045 [Streptomyces sp. WMMC500]
MTCGSTYVELTLDGAWRVFTNQFHRGGFPLEKTPYSSSSH